MMREPNKRPRRNPMTSEEVSQIIAYKRKRELVILQKLKKSRAFKVQNIFNVACIFIYLEIIFCYFGPCHYSEHSAWKTVPHYGPGNSMNGKLYISDLDVFSAEGKVYKFVVNDCVEFPSKAMKFIIGKDFLIQKELKAVVEYSGSTYRLFAASPVLFLCAFASFISFFGFVMNLNENEYTLGGLTALNLLALFAILTI